MSARVERLGQKNVQLTMSREQFLSVWKILTGYVEDSEDCEEIPEDLESVRELVTLCDAEVARSAEEIHG